MKLREIKNHEEEIETKLKHNGAMMPIPTVKIKMPKVKKPKENDTPNNKK